MAWLALALGMHAFAGEARARTDPGVLGGILAGTLAAAADAAAAPAFQEQLTLQAGNVDMAILDRMQARLQSSLADVHLDSRCYERRSFGQRVYRYCFDYSLVRATVDTTVTLPRPWRDEPVVLKPQLALLKYGFAARTGDDMGSDSHNLAAFLNSAYHQELYPEYAKADSNFLPPLRKSQLGLWTRGAVSMGWGVQYAARGNPFQTGAAVGLVKWLLYGVDAIFYVGMAVAATEGKDAEAGLLYAAQAKALHTGISYAIFTPLLSLELAETLRIRDSGYRLPIGLRFQW